MKNKNDIDNNKDNKDKDNAKDGNNTITAIDPVLGKPISVTAIKLCTPEEASAYIKKYNNVLEEKKGTDDSAGNSPNSSPKKSSMSGNNGNDNENFNGNNGNSNGNNSNSNSNNINGSNGNNEYKNERKSNNDQQPKATRQAY